jgi:hypothetical protein
MTLKAFGNICFKPIPPKRSGVHCDVIVKTVNAHLTVGKYCRLTNEITKKQVRFLPSPGLQKPMSSLRYPNHGINIADT